MREARPAFTLIELLIVVAIIAILAAIAVPNFLEAQVRAKVSRAKADMRSLATALETYRIDRNDYPFRAKAPASPLLQGIGDSTRRRQDWTVVTTPVAYISTIPQDVFENTLAPPNNVLDYWSPKILESFDPPRPPGWAIVSVGPDNLMGQFGNMGGLPPPPPEAAGTMQLDYDPTNGTISLGNVYRFQSQETAMRVFFQ
ncbi:prepilin-type N-terminal cleavage/methylation domain-containing protein [Candidatus Poribacteria bacterium]|nr:prepilin-type N-terminal cleavage/methylation domain-containing protein [Candidatus Poribacteria bacterium]